MSANLTSVSFRIDSKLKKDADTLFESLGLNLTTAFNIFLRQAVREGGIPFMITTNTPNAETVAAIEEAREIAKSSSKGVSVEEAIKILKENPELILDGELYKHGKPLS